MAKQVQRKTGKNWVVALSEFTYDGQRLSRQEAFELRGKRNDQRLIELRYLLPVEPGKELSQCAECGATFIDPHWLKVHGDIWHSFECDACGWAPSPGVLDKDSAIRRHRQRCPGVVSARERDHKEHVEARVAEIESQPVEVAS